MEASTCYDGGDVAGAIFGTLVVVVAIAALGYLLYKKKLNKKKGEWKFVYYARSNFFFQNDATFIYKFKKKKTRKRQ